MLYDQTERETKNGGGQVDIFAHVGWGRAGITVGRD
jgi:hypothetical protein